MISQILSDPIAVYGVGGAVVVLTIQGAWKTVQIAIAAFAKRTDAATAAPAPVCVATESAELCRAHGERLSSLETSSKATGETIREIRRDVKCIDGKVGKLLTLSEAANGKTGK